MLRRHHATGWGRSEQTEPLCTEEHSPSRPSGLEFVAKSERRQRALKISAILFVGLLFHLLGRWQRASSGGGLNHFGFSGGAAPLAEVAKDLRRAEAKLKASISAGHWIESTGESAGSALAGSGPLLSQWCQQGATSPRLAIGIAAQPGQAQSLHRLLDILRHPDIAVKVHLEAAASHQEHKALREMVSATRAAKPTFSSIEVMSPAAPVSERGISALDVNLRFIDSFVREICGWQYFLNLSAEDFPLLQPTQIMAVLDSAPPGSNFVDVNHKEYFGTILSRTTHVVLDDSVHRLDAPPTTNHTSPFRRRYPNLFTPYHGEAWHVLSRDFSEYIATTTDGFPRRLFSYYTNSASSTEGYFQTLLCASDFADTLVNDCLRYVDWSHPNAWNPAPITDLNMAKVRSSGALFARPVKDKAIADKLQWEVVAPADSRAQKLLQPRAAAVASPEAARQRLAAALQKPQGCAAVALHAKEAYVRGLNSYHWP